jgi:hypothetical protein
MSHIDRCDQIGMSSRSVSMSNLRLRSWDNARKKPTQPIVGNELLVTYKFASLVVHKSFLTRTPLRHAAIPTYRYMCM